MGYGDDGSQHESPGQRERNIHDVWILEGRLVGKKVKHELNVTRNLRLKVQDAMVTLKKGSTLFSD